MSSVETGKLSQGQKEQTNSPHDLISIPGTHRISEVAQSLRACTSTAEDHGLCLHPTCPHTDFSSKVQCHRKRDVFWLQGTRKIITYIHACKCKKIQVKPLYLEHELNKSLSKWKKGRKGVLRCGSRAECPGNWLYRMS